ncbi:pectate lyase [Parafrankia sp. FMc6]|uniref:pectate lyase n=1 Tax=Parafrankia soli TaxID=2599596 RepID=UPI0034D521CD
MARRTSTRHTYRGESTSSWEAAPAGPARGARPRAGWGVPVLMATLALGAGTLFAGCQPFDGTPVGGGGAPAPTSSPTAGPTAPVTQTPTAGPGSPAPPAPPVTATPSAGPSAPASPTTAPTAGPTTSASPGAPASQGPLPSWPRATADVDVSSTISVTGTFDGGLKRYSGVSDGGQEEGQDPIFDVADGGTVQNVIIGSPAADGIHCKGTCTLRNVWWEDVGEDAATFKGTSAAQTMTIDGGGARGASDKVFQHNGPGTMVIQNFQVQDFGKLYRSCGNCSKQYARHVVVRNVTVTAPGKTLVGVNTNYGDSAQLSGVTIVGDSSRKISICDRYTGNSSGSEPTKTGSGVDGTYCRYTPSDIAYR